MNKQCMVALFTVGLLASATAQAAIKDWLPEPATDVTGLKTIYAGAGVTGQLFHLNAEVPTGYGNVYAKVGGFLDGPKEAAGQVGFRYPYYLTGTDKNGYYFGGFIGHIETRSLDDKKYNRLGAGGELSYVWMNKSRISAASVGIAVGEEKTGRYGTKERAKPMVLASYSFNFGIY
ncbi:hypothetical protein ACF3NA_03945 [Alkanindiges sp. WGS2144]|uniref:hypothetical protein n=1 Tax=Alkanindiges sp. WGS2144 TaxID=3366808 RepID=UPI003751B20E